MGASTDVPVPEVRISVAVPIPEECTLDHLKAVVDAAAKNIPGESVVTFRTAQRGNQRDPYTVVTDLVVNAVK